MKPTRRSVLAAGGSALAALACGRVATPGFLASTPRSGDDAFDVSSDERVDLAQHVLARCTFGPRPGDRAALLALAPTQAEAVAAWIERQLDPASIDDSDAERAVRRLDSLDAPVAELFEYRPQVLLRELTAAAILRATFSRRQLFETMVELWTDHFNVDSSKGECAWLQPAFDRDVIRAHALGTFPELLRAVTLSPAMLWYLDGRANVARGRPNENHARELLELHGLGVHGGYAQRDVMEAARCLTGWTVRDKSGLRKATVELRAEEHDDGEKTVLGERFPAGGGARDVEQLVELVARHPATATHVATKLCRRFVADDPPAPVVEATANAFRASGGDVRATLRALFARPELVADEHARATKLKRPFHLLVSMLRATDAATDAGPALAAYLARMGQAPFQYPTPEGYPQEASAWQGALFWRWKLADAIATGRIAGTRVDAERLVERAGGRERLAAHLFHRAPNAAERDVIARAGDARSSLALMLASPAFQRA